MFFKETCKWDLLWFHDFHYSDMYKYIYYAEIYNYVLNSTDFQPDDYHCLDLSKFREGIMPDCILKVSTTKGRTELKNSNIKCTSFQFKIARPWVDKFKKSLYY